MEDAIEGKDFSFPSEEEKILNFWDATDAFKEQLKQTEGKKEYVFYDGPPFATGLPHYGHILAGTLKDVVTRYASQTGHHVVRRFGWDCHGLPVEYEIDKKLDIKSPDQVLAMGIDNYNEECRSIVMRYAKEWEVTVHRLGRWIDFENDYKTLDPSFMESVWWVFSQLWEKDLVYRGFKVMPFSTACSTTLSNFEAGLNYKDVSDPAVMVSFPLIDDPDNAAMVAWTTTPWTLPSNLALCVHPEFDYVKLQDPKTGNVYIVAESRIGFLPGAVPKKKGGKKGKDASKEDGQDGFKVIAKMKGQELKGRPYKPLFDYFKPQYAATAWRVATDTYVTDDSGTGVVHQAPAFGEDDYRVCISQGIVAKGDAVPCPVDAAGRFTDPVSDFKGLHVKDADKQIIQAIKAAGRLVDNATLVHSYPFCWRSDTPLIYKAVPSWFVRVEKIRDQLLANNEQTYWVPSYVKEKRFHNWLENARDWAVSRSRYWGTPIPIWVSDDFEERVVIGSVEELEKLSGRKVTDLHRHFIDDIEIPSKMGKGMLKRVPDVFDCWFESGSMPYAQQHYPFENKDYFERNFPADFIAEGLDQTRGWFYTLMVLSTALFGKPAFKNLVCNGLVLAADGKKMSKRLKNYPDPTLVVNKYGADALRLYLINSPVVRAEPLRFEEKGVYGVVKDVFLPWYNAYRFLTQNVVRLGTEGHSFEPASIDLSAASNVLDRWIQAATRSLVNTVRQQMELYQLYNVVPFLVRFIDDLTNIYVRYNRKRLKGRNGVDDCRMALATLFDSLLKVCTVMAPFTPFLTENMYQNLRKALGPDAPTSIHFCDIPEAVEAQAGDEQIQQSVHRMQRVIELGRVLRERHNRPFKTPLRSLTVAHDSPEFIADLTGELANYVKEELNVSELHTADPDNFGTLKAEPNWAALGARLGKQMGSLGKDIKALTAADVKKFQAEGRLQVGAHELGAADLTVRRELKALEGNKDINGDGEVLVVLDLEQDESLQAQGVARDIVNRFQKLRKKAGLQVTDVVEAFYHTCADGESAAALEATIQSQGAYIVDNLGMPVLPKAKQPLGGVVIASEVQCVQLSDTVKAEFVAVLTAPAVSVDAAAVERDMGADVAQALCVYMASKDWERAKSEGAGGEMQVHLNGRVVKVQVGQHVFWSAKELP